MFAKLMMRSLWGRKGRTLLVIIAMTIPATLVTGAINFLLDSSAKMTREIRSHGPNLVVRPIGESLETAATSAVRLRYPEYAEVREGVGVVRHRTREIQAKWLGIDPARARRVWTWWRVEGEWPRNGECLLGRRLADRLRVGRGEDLAVDGRSLRVSGFLESEGEEERAVVFRLDEFGSDRLSRIDFVLDPDEVEAAAAEIHRELPQTTAEPVRALTASEGKIAAKLRGVALFVSGFVLVLSGIAIAAALSASVQERRREIALMTALGTSRALMARLLISQGAILLGASLLVGGAMGLGLSELLGRTAFGSSTAVRPLSFAVALVACGAMAACALILPAKRALALEPTTVLREE